jgi:hypothetical protein
MPSMPRTGRGRNAVDTANPATLSPMPDTTSRLDACGIMSP